jgi:hypothetical protein
MNKSELIELLKNDEATITFKKVNGDNRVMTCTLKESVISRSADSSVATKTRNFSDAVVAVWDVEKQGWRSFVFDNLVSVETRDGVVTKI